jgi:hypothetical protein
LPLGFELRDEVLRASQNFPYATVLRKRGTEDSEFGEFAQDLATSGFSSVDAFLEQRPAWTSIGKAAMALCLLSSEYHASQRLFPPTEPADHWYQVLWSQIKASGWTAFKRQPLTIVTFNYDRSLECYLARVISNNYRIKPVTAASALPIIHVHGSLGTYDDVAFGKPITDQILDAACESIRVVHEADVAHSEFTLARKRIADADRVLFIGFGYLDANMRKLGFGVTNEAKDVSKRVMGTHKGIKSQAWERIRMQYGFSPEARAHGAGSVSEFVAEWFA